MPIKTTIAKNHRVITVVFLVLLLTAAMFVSSIAGNATNKPILFINNSCTHCEQIINDIQALEFGNLLEIKIRNIDNSSLHKESFSNASETCEIEEQQRGVPMLYHEQECFKGTIAILQELERLSIENER